MDGQGDEPLDRKRLDIGPEGREMVRIAGRHGGNPLTADFLSQQWRTRPQGRLGEAVRRLGRHQPGGRVDDDRGCAAIYPAAFQGRDITRRPQQPVTGGAVALGRDNRFGNRTGVFCRDPVSEQDPGHKIGQFDDADGPWHRIIVG